VENGCVRLLAVALLLACCSHPVRPPLANTPPAVVSAASGPYFTTGGAPDPLACKADKECLGDTITDAGGCCVPSPLPWPQTWAYHTWLSNRRMSDACKSIKCPDLPPPEEPEHCRRCALQERPVCEHLHQLRMRVIALALVSACHLHGARDPLPSQPVHVDWSMARVPTGLQVVYEVRNDGDRPIWLVDNFENTDRLVVRNDGPGVVAFVAASTPPDPGIAIEHTELWLPGLHALAGHASFSRTVTVPLPLQAWHNLGPDAVWHLNGDESRAVLKIGYLPGDPTGAALLAFSKQVIVDGEVLDLPGQGTSLP
jgi:hypothetical protein